MQKRIAKCDQDYARRSIKAGEEFEVEDRDVKTLLVIGRIEPKRGEPGYVAPKERAKQKAAA